VRDAPPGTARGTGNADQSPSARGGRRFGPTAFGPQPAPRPTGGTGPDQEEGQTHRPPLTKPGHAEGPPREGNEGHKFDGCAIPANPPPPDETLNKCYPSPMTEPLQRRLSLTDASALVVGCIIGAGIFRLSDSVARQSSSVGLFLAAWVIGGLLSLCGALVWAELATRFPRNGGEYVFLSHTFGRAWGFVYGFTRLFVNRTGTLAILAYVFAEHLARAAGASAGVVRPTATAAVVLLTVLNAAGLRFGKNIQNVFTALKVSALLGIIVVGALAGKGEASHFTPLWVPSGNWLSQLGLALIPVLWTYGGWYEAAYVAGEVKNPERNLPRAIVGGLLVTTALYLAVNLVYVYYLPLPTLRETDLVAAGAMDRVFSGAGGRLVAAAVMVSTFGALNGYILSGGAHSGGHGRGPRAVPPVRSPTPRHRHADFGAPGERGPHVGFDLDGNPGQHRDVHRDCDLPVFRDDGGSRRWSCGGGTERRRGSTGVWGFPYTPAVFIALNLAIVVNGVFEQPREALFGIAVAAIGIPLYWISWSLDQKKTDPA
jgi:APA family basic amino acid/polyamine antiporter